MTRRQPPRPCLRGCGGFLAMRETKSCAACRAADKIRPCPYCGTQLGERQTKCCGAPACKEKYRLDRQARAKERARERYQTDSEYRQRVRGWNAAWRKHEPEAWAESQQKHYLANREKKIAQASANAVIRRARIKGATVVPFTAQQLRDRMSVYDRCWICGSGSWTEVDHVKPISKGGPHMLANLRPACLPCNRRKLATWPIDTSITRKG